MFCEQSLGKIKFRVLPKCVGPRILSLESVDYFGASEHYGVVGCCKLSLYANESCDEHVIYFWQ